MKLSDIMGAAGLAFYAEVALALFLFAFLLVVVDILARHNQKTWEQARLLPLDEPKTKPTSGGVSERPAP